MTLKGLSTFYRRLLVAMIGALLAAPVQAVEIVAVETSGASGNVTLGGTVIPFKEVTLTAQIPGRVEFLAGSEGDQVQTSQVLVTIDDDDIRAQRRAAVAQLNQADAAMRNAGVQYSRELWSPQSNNINRMPGMGMPSMFDQMFTRNMGDMFGYGNPNVDRTADLYNQSAQVNQAWSQVLQARSRIEELDARLRDARATAPFDGVIVRKLVELGDTVQPGQALMVFAQTEFLRIQADIPARLMAGISRGMFVPARLDVGDTLVQARVAQIYPVADAQRHTVTVKFDLPKGVPGGPGMYAEITIPDPDASAPALPVIPRRALVRRGSLPYVFVMNNDNRVELRIIRTGGNVGPDRVSVLAGLRAGERVLVDPPPGISSGWSPADPATTR